MSSGRHGVPAGVRRAFRLPWSRRRAAREIDEEVRFHVEMRVADLVARGMSPDDARSEALRRFGDADDLRTYCQTMENAHMRRLRFRDWLESWTNDLRLATRLFRRSPGFALLTTATLAVGIGATTAIFSVVNGVILRPLPYAEPDRIVQLWEVAAEGHHMMVTDPNFEDIRAASRSFIALAQEQGGPMVSVTGAGDPVRARAARVSREFFDVLGVRPALGRLFGPDEARVGGAPAVVISHGFWQRHFGGDPGVLGSIAQFDGLGASIVGVMPPGFASPTETDLWYPAELRAPRPSRTAHNWRVIGRLAPGVSFDQARNEVSTIVRRLKEEHGNDMTAVDAALVPLHEQIVGHARPALWLLLGASAVLLLIACTNVVNLLVARMAARQGEIAMRVALGAGRSRIFQQSASESLLLAIGGAALGLLVAHWGVQLVLALHPAAVPRAGTVRVDWSVGLFAVALAVVIALVLGAIAAWKGTRGDLREALSQSQRTQSGAGSSARVRRALVVAQMAMTVVLLVGAGLLGRSFARILTLDPGFRTEGAVVLSLAVPAPDSAGTERRARFYDELLTRVRMLPGVTDAGTVNALPLSFAGANGTFIVMSRPDEIRDWDDFRRLVQMPGRTGDAEYRVASAGYFEAMGIPLLAGRTFGERDLPDGQHVAVVSASVARTQWPDQDPIGRFVQFGNMDGDLRGLMVVGVVGDVRERGLASPPRPAIYVFYSQRPVSMHTMYTVIRTGNATAAIPVIRQMVRELRPDVPPVFRTIEEIVSGSVSNRRFVLALVGSFAAAALLLAALGIYGVVSYVVAQRERELGIRVALGARYADILRLVLRQGALLALIGIAIGALASIATTRLLAGMLYEISTTDPVAFAGVTAVLAAVALVASYVPARRAARLDAVEVLRGG